MSIDKFKPNTVTPYKDIFCKEYGLQFKHIAKLIGYSTVHTANVLNGRDRMTRKFEGRLLILLGLVEIEDIQEKISKLPEYKFCMNKVKELEALMESGSRFS